MSSLETTEQDACLIEHALHQQPLFSCLSLSLRNFRKAIGDNEHGEGRGLSWDLKA